MPRLLSHDLATWSAGTWDGTPPAVFTGICHDSRHIQPGHIFLAIRGATHDGHEFLSAAFERGATAAIVNTDWSRTPRDPAIPVLRVTDTHRALAALASAYRQAVNPVVIGITGSAGKSTAKEMTAQLLSRKYTTARTRGNWNNDIGLPLSLLNMEPDTTHGVFEVGTNHPGEIEALCATLQPDHAVVTNVAAVHIAHFENLEAIIHEKGALLRAIPARGRAFLNSNLSCFNQLASYCACPVVTVSTGKKGDYHVDGVSADGVATVHEVSSGVRLHFHLPVPGEHNLANALMAIAVARQCGLDFPDIVAGLEAFESMPMRWQTQHINGALVINDAYNANPLSMRAAISTFMNTPANRRWLVLGGMLELGTHEKNEHASLGEYIAHEAKPDALLVIGALGLIVAEHAIASGMPAAQVFCCKDTLAATDNLRKAVQPGDAILLKGSRGFRLETIVHALTGTEASHG